MGNRNTQLKTSKLPITMLALSCVLAACSEPAAQKQTIKHLEPSELHQHYTQLVKQGASLSTLSAYWSEDALALMVNAQGRVDLDSHGFILRYPENFQVPPQASANNVLDESNMCLLAVGEASDGGTLAMSLLFTKGSDGWQHQEIFARYLTSDQPMPAEPDCT